MAAKRSTTKSGKPRQTKAQKRLDRRWSFLLFAIGIVLIIFCFVKAEANVAHWLQSNLLFGIFGITAWLLGPLFIYWGVLIGMSKPVKPAVFKGLFLMIVLAAVFMLFGKTDYSEIAFKDAVPLLMQTGQNSRFGAGVISFIMGWTLWALCGTILARCLIVVLVLLAVMVVASVTPADIAGFFGGQYSKHSENYKQKKQERLDYEATFDEEYEDDYYEDGPLPLDTTQRKNAKKLVNPFAQNITKEPAPAEPKQNNTPIKPPVSTGVATEDNLFSRDVTPQFVAGTAFDPLGIGVGAKPAQPEHKLLFGEDDPHANLLGDSFEDALSTLKDLETPQKERHVFELLDEKAPENADELLMDSSTSRLIEKAAEAAAEDDKAKFPQQRDEGETTFRALYKYPPMNLLEHVADTSNSYEAKEEMRKTAEKLISTLNSFGVQTTIMDVTRGPSVTRYEIKPQEGVKISRITNLSDDIALNLAAAGVRIEAPIPGKPAVGIEVPNVKKSIVGIRSILESRAFAEQPHNLPMALGKDISGTSVVADLSKMPHLLIAGSTGSGKSVCVNSIIMSFLFKFKPEDLRLLLIDPKIVELAEYNAIPHLMMPVVTDSRKAAGALGSAAAEMDRRYRLFAENGARDFKAYNKIAEKSGLEKIPYTVIVIDELADLMMVAGKEVETHICRIAQKARAAGMHLIVATQRPSVDVITGLIKANIPSRIAFAVSSQIDSRTILDGAGAEKLLGMGDMLYMPVGANKPVRIQGTYVKDKEISLVLEFIKKHGKAQYDEKMIEDMERLSSSDDNGAGSSFEDGFARDDMFDEAVDIAFDTGQVSTSFLQRRLRVGYARAGRLVDEMEQLGIISAPEGSKPRQLLISRERWLEMSMALDDKKA